MTGRLRALALVGLALYAAAIAAVVLGAGFHIVHGVHLVLP